MWNWLSRLKKQKNFSLFKNGFLNTKEKIKRNTGNPAQKGGKGKNRAGKFGKIFTGYPQNQGVDNPKK